MTRLLPDGRELTVSPLLFGRARLRIGEAGAMVYDDAW